MAQRQDADTTGGSDASGDAPATSAASTALPHDALAPDLDAPTWEDRDDEDTVTLPRLSDVPPPDACEVDPFIDDVDADEDSSAAQHTDHGDAAADSIEESDDATPVDDASSPSTGLARYETTDTIPVVGDALPITGSMPVVGPIYPPKARRPWIIATVVLAVAVLGAGYMGWRMWQINHEWQEYASNLTDANYALGEQVADVKKDLEEKQSEVDLISEQLSTSNSRLLDLANEKATAIDDQEYASQVIAEQKATLKLGRDATASLNQCIDGLEQLTTYLRAPEDDYDPEQVKDYAEGVTKLCDASDSATSRFQQALTQ